ncbi:glycosyltransferase family 2 protein [Luteimonas sp. SDU82]|uniref:glycosyltransferase family 2 protein n=1 Tax=Luteimonas sp. SDU82 TaxID=3422592 RepID=UPI003EBD2014
MKLNLVVNRGLQPKHVALRPEPTLTPVDRAEVGARWNASGDRAAFAVKFDEALQALAAGWYRFTGRLLLDDPIAGIPCLYPVYGSGLGGDAQIELAAPGPGGRIDALVLFKQDVTGLRFSPVEGPALFELDDLVLRRVGRVEALWRMLGPTARVPGGTAARALRFASHAVRCGLSPATDALYRDYRRRLLPEDAGEYAGWVARFDTLTTGRMEDMRARASRISSDSAPLVSVLVPTYNTPERWLRRCIESVISQVYPHWQLCIADDASPDPRVMEVLREYAAADPRIEIMRRPANGHISQASNSALSMARGDYVGLLDHDDELRPHALLEMAEAILANPGVGLLYSDEDKLDEEGRRFDPYFKPDWNPDLLRAQNYVCHFTVIRTDLVRKVGGFREGFEGSQDHDLFLRCIEELPPGGIHHVPRVLYHWRAITGSTALSRDAKDYAAEAGERAVADHLARRYPGARVEGLSHGHYRVRWPMPEPPPKVSLIIPTRDRVDLLRTCVDSILSRTSYPAYEVVVVDNQSSDPAALDYLAQLDRDPRVRVLRYDAPFNYSAINNWAAGRCDGAVLGLLNNDVEVISPDWLDELVSQAVRPGVGAVGAMLYYPNDTIQHAGVVLGIHGVAAHQYAGMSRGYPGHGGRARVAQELSAVTGACLVVTRAAYESVGGLDEALQVAFNDIDFCLRLLEAGYRNVWTPFAELYHHESASRGAEDTDEKRERFGNEVALMLRRWGPRLARDPAYNPNLTLESPNSELASPPRGAP